MARSRKRKHSSRRRVRRNPTGTLLVNPRRKGRKSRSRSSSLSGILSRFLGSKKRNPSRKHKASRKHRKHSRSRRNPLMVNPLMVNPASGLLGSVQRDAQKVVGRLPLIGGLLSGAIGMLGGAVGGAVGVLPTTYAMPYIAPYLPDMAKPFGYTIGGVALATLIQGIGPMIPGVGKYAGKLAMVTVASGGAVDAYRAVKGNSQNLGEDDMDSLLSSLEIGESGEPLAATEYADASLADAEYIGGDDFTHEEIAAAELGRRHYGRRFFRHRRIHPGESNDGGSSDHAGQPGRRFGWLIYWIGFNNFRQITQLPESDRRAAIAKMRHEARLRARKLLSEGQSADIKDAEMAGLLVTA